MKHLNRFLIPLLCAISTANATITLPGIFSDHAVLQKTEKVPIWGKAAPNEKVTVTIHNATASTTANADGKWKLELNLKSETEGPFELTIEATNKITLKDVLIGQVWLCSGQSNMAFTLKGGEIHADQQYTLPPNPRLRFFDAARRSVTTLQEDLPGRWLTATPENLPTFSAVAYYFGKKLHNELNTPIGLISASWGGTCVEQWLSPEAMDADPQLKETKDKQETLRQNIDNFIKEYPLWAEKYSRKEHPLPTDLDPYAKPDAPTTDWKTITLPAKFSDIGLPDAGAVWLRKKITLPNTINKKYFFIEPGDHRDNITIYLDGKKVAQSDYPFVSNQGNIQRIRIGSDANTPGNDITLAIRIHSPSCGMGILTPKGYSFNIVDKTSLKLDGEWLAKVEYQLPPLDDTAKKTLPPRPPYFTTDFASNMYQGMIHPITTYAIAGAIWYQGESNTARAYQYRTSFPLMIRDWRQKWAQGDFPFYYCQIAFFNHRPRNPLPEESDTAELREAQATALTLPNTAMAILIDAGEENDIHPRDKETPGNRLAAIALAKTYGKTIPYQGPTYQSMNIEGNKIRIKFQNTHGKLIAKPLPPTYLPKTSEPDKTKPLPRNNPNSEIEGFTICGEDHKWTWADAKIENDTVVVTAPTIEKPIAVRYAWGAAPFCNLYNAADLPAAPFRTDDFPLKTKDNRY